MEDITKSLDDMESKFLNSEKIPKKIKVVIIILIILTIFFAAAMIFFIIFYFTKTDEIEKKSDNHDNEDYLLEINGFKEKWYDIYGNRTINISYVEKDKIPNSFHKNGGNYREEIGDINEGIDYSKHEDVNVYDLYIPYSSLSKKNESNGIILFVHGGGFENNTKEETECFAVRFAKLGYITANIEYSNCLDKYKEKSFFRIIDEITACIKSIKYELESQGFDGSKLKLSLYGISAGGQLILLYAFLNKIEIIPLKFIINSVGISDMDDFYWYKPAIKNETLDNIENISDIENARNAKTIVPIDPQFVLHIMNLMTGKKLKQDELDKLIVNGRINKDDEKYKQMYKYAKYGSPFQVIENKIIPMLCLYGGNDDLVGVAHYSHLREAYIKNNADDKIELVYMKYGGHERFHHGTEHDIKAMKEMHYKMVEYAEKYFNSDSD